MKSASAITLQLLIFYFSVMIWTTPLNFTEDSINLTTGFARCFDSTDAGRQLVRPSACQTIAAYLISQPQYRETKEYTAGNLPGPFGSQGCFVDVRVVRPEANDRFSIAQVGSVARLVSDRCEIQYLQRNRGGFGLVGQRNQFIVDVYNPPPTGILANVTEIPLEPATIL